MKTFDEIINRKDYKHLTVKLREKTAMIAKAIRRKMYELDMQNVKYETKGGVRFGIVEGSTNVGSYEYMAVFERDEFGDEKAYCVDGGYNGYIHGDFNHYCRQGSNAQVLAFLNASGEILEGLSEAEDEKVKEIETALARNQYRDQ